MKQTLGSVLHFNRVKFTNRRSITCTSIFELSLFYFGLNKIDEQNAFDK